MSTLRYDKHDILHDAADDMGAWAIENEPNLRAGLYDARAYTQAEQERKRTVQESVLHMVGVDNPAHCRGISCNGGREPCRDRCHAEMGNVERPDAIEVVEVRPMKWLGVAVVLVLACIGAGALTSYFGG